MLMMGVLLLAGTTFAGRDHDPMMANKLNVAGCQAAILDQYLLGMYSEGCANQDTNQLLDGWHSSMWGDEGAFPSLEGIYEDSQSCCNGVCDQACIRQYRGQFMSGMRTVSSLTSSGRALLLRAGRECIQNEEMTGPEFQEIWRGYWSDTMQCFGSGGAVVID